MPTSPAFLKIEDQKLSKGTIGRTLRSWLTGTVREGKSSTSSIRSKGPKETLSTRTTTGEFSRASPPSPQVLTYRLICRSSYRARWYSLARASLPRPTNDQEDALWRDHSTLRRPSVVCRSQGEFTVNPYVSFRVGACLPSTCASGPPQNAQFVRYPLSTATRQPFPRPSVHLTQATRLDGSGCVPRDGS